MKDVFKNYLFTKGVLVSDGEKDPNAFSVLFSLANRFNIKITEGAELAREEMIATAAGVLGEYVPESFYRGFPGSVRNMTKDQLLFDQLLHYFVSYGMGNFSEAGHSLFEENFSRLAFGEREVPVKELVILDEAAALERLTGYVESMLASSRPLSDTQYEVTKVFIGTYRYAVKHCACKDTLMRLLLDTRNLSYARMMALSDVLVLVERLNYQQYGNDDIKRLNLRNRDRKFIARVIELAFARGKRNVKDCFEKKAIWCGLLHHIHFKPSTAELAAFVTAMRTKGNESAYAHFERAMLDEDVRRATEVLKTEKGSGALLRHLNYIISRCKTEQDVVFVMEALNAKRPILLIQLMKQYARYQAGEARTFKFSKFNLMKVHCETDREVQKRRSTLSDEQVALLYGYVTQQLADLLRGKLGKVYISPAMYSIALPLQENTSNGGFGVLPKGSRLKVGEGKKIRAFTYWEKVNDIDLSVIGLREDGRQEEFSWRTMARNQSEALTFSGDQTCGFEGGSEFFDVDVDKVLALYPNMKYLVFCNNMFSDLTFDRCLCKAGFMLRDVEDSGEVFEPQTVSSSFIVNCDSTFAYLFGLDLKAKEFVWLNAAKQSSDHVAGTTGLGFLEEYFESLEVINMGKLFELMATELVTDPAEAEVVVSDEAIEVAEGVEVVHSYDFEKVAVFLG